jgi:hypothetical protein
MATRLNLYSNGQIAANQAYLDNFDRITWSPGGVKRDALGLPIKRRRHAKKEVEEDANIQE